MRRRTTTTRRRRREEGGRVRHDVRRSPVIVLIFADACRHPIQADRHPVAYILIPGGGGRGVIYAFTHLFSDLFIIMLWIEIIAGQLYFLGSHGNPREQPPRLQPRQRLLQGVCRVI